MAYSTLKTKIDYIKRKCSDSVIEEPFLDKKLFFYNPNCKLGCDPITRAHLDLHEKNKELISNVVTKMQKNDLFKHFICCNLHDYLNIANNKFSSFVHENREYDDQVDLLYLKNFGFLDPDKEPLDEEINKFYSFLTERFLEQMGELSNSELCYADLEKCSEELRMLFGLEKKYVFRNGTIDFDTLPEHINSFFNSWQLSHFFEEYISKIISQNSEVKIIKNPLIFINPFFHKKKGRVSGFIELDGCLIKRKEELFFIECKNGYRLTGRHLFSFLGKVNFIEKLYDVKIKKFLVSTGKENPLLWGIDKFKFEDIGVFSWQDYKNNYSNLLNKLNSP